MSTIPSLPRDFIIWYKWRESNSQHPDFESGTSANWATLAFYLVRMVGLEPTRHTAGDFKSPVSAIPPHPRGLKSGAGSENRTRKPLLAADSESAMFTYFIIPAFYLVRKVGLEPTRSCEQQCLKLSCLPFQHFRFI